MKKTIGSKIIAGTMAASVILAGAGFVHSQAFAAAKDTTKSTGTTATTTATAGDDFGGRGKHHGGHSGDDGGERGGFGFGGGSLLQETATVLGVDQAAVSTALQSGKTLVQVAADKGISEADFLAKLTAAETKAIDDAVTAGKLTKAQADSQKTGLAAHLKEEISEVGHVGPHDGRGFGKFGNPADTAAVLGITQSELNTQLQAGKSLVDIAQSKGISEDQLITKIKDSMNDELKQYVEFKRTPASTSTSTAANTNS
jgi:uncharacterized protein YidB (DUF937 family)